MTRTHRPDPTSGKISEIIPTRGSPSAAQKGQNGPPLTAEKSSKKHLPGPTSRDLSDAARAFRGNPRGQSMHWDLFFPPMIGRSAPIAYLRARNLMQESSDILLISHTGRRSGPIPRTEREIGEKTREGGSAEFCGSSLRAKDGPSYLSGCCVGRVWRGVRRRPGGRGSLGCVGLRGRPVGALVGSLWMWVWAGAGAQRAAGRWESLGWSAAPCGWPGPPGVRVGRRRSFGRGSLAVAGLWAFGRWARWAAVGRPGGGGRSCPGAVGALGVLGCVGLGRGLVPTCVGGGGGAWRGAWGCCVGGCWRLCAVWRRSLAAWLGAARRARRGVEFH